MSWLNKFTRRSTIEKAIEIPYAQCDVIIGNGAYIAHNHIFVNPDLQSFLAGIIITCDNNPSVSAKLLSRPEQNRMLSQYMCDNGLADPKNYPLPFMGGDDEVLTALKKLDVRYQCFHPMDSFRLHEPIPGSSSIYVGSLFDPRVQEKTIDKMRRLLVAVSGTNLVSGNINIRMAMVDKMRLILGAEPFLKIDGKTLLGPDNEGVNEESGHRPAFNPAQPHDGKTLP